MATAAAFPSAQRNFQSWSVEAQALEFSEISDIGHPLAGTLPSNIFRNSTVKNILNEDLMQFTDDVHDSCTSAKTKSNRDESTSCEHTEDFASTCSNMDIPLKLSGSLYTSSNSEMVNTKKKLSLGRIPRFIECYLCARNIKEDNFSEHLLFGPVRCSKCSTLYKDCKDFQHWIIEYSLGDYACDHDLSYIYDSPSYLFNKIGTSLLENGSQTNQSLLLKKYIAKLTSVENQDPWKHAIQKCKLYLTKTFNTEENVVCADISTGDLNENLFGVNPMKLGNDHNNIESPYLHKLDEGNSELPSLEHHKGQNTENGMNNFSSFEGNAKKNESMKASNTGSGRTMQKEGIIPNLIIKKSSDSGKYVCDISKTNNQMFNETIHRKSVNIPSPYNEEPYTESPESYLSRVYCENSESDQNLNTLSEERDTNYETNGSQPSCSTDIPVIKNLDAADGGKYVCENIRSEVSGGLKIKIKIPKKRSVRDQHLPSSRGNKIIKRPKKMKFSAENEVSQPSFSSKIEENKLTDKVSCQKAGDDHPSVKDSSLSHIPIVENDYYLVSKTVIEECPMCYEILCPSQMTLNTVNFLITVVCINCNLTIYISSSQVHVVTNNDLTSNQTRKVGYCGPRSRRRSLAPQNS